MTSNNIKVSIKIRPLIQREKNDNLPSLWSLIDENTIKSNNKEYKLSFDHIFEENRKTEEIFNIVAKPIVENAVKGINGTIFAYGQTSSGKTYCMMGTEEEPGIIPLTVNEIFRQIELTEDREFLIRVGYIEIYNEKIYDLLLENKAEICKVHETSGEVVVNQTEIVTSSIQHILESYDKGNKGRRVGETCMNERSSRSHTLFKIIIESHENGSKDGVFQVSTLNLVDLAGSERVDQTKATGERLREGGHINKSLLSLSKVIRELSDLNDEKSKNTDGIKYINYRDSKLTRILSASLGGNAMTAIICTITPVALEETYSTLMFASNAKKIKNQPKVNETVSDKVIMTRLQKEISELKGKLEEERSKNSEVSKIQKLISQIFDRESQIIHFQPGKISKSVDANRRRTWMCPTTLDKTTEEMHPLAKNNLMAPPPFILKQNSVSPNPEEIFSSSDDFLSNEIFQSPDKIQFEKQMIFSSSRRNTLRNFSPSQIRTPRSLKTIVEVDSPQIGKPKSINDENGILKARIRYLENELEELQDFKTLEENIMSSISTDDIKILEENFERTKQQLFESEQKVDMLENDMMDKMIEIENLKDLKEKFDSMTVELNEANQKKQNAENILESVKYEYEQAQIKFKNREKDLINLLEEARTESTENDNVLKEKIKNLEQILRKTEEDLHALETQKMANQTEKMTDSGKLTDMKNNIKDLEIKLELAIKERERSVQALNDKNSELETLSDQIVESVQEIDSLEDRLKKMDELLKLKDNEFGELTLKLTDLEKISNRYQKIQKIIATEETVPEFVCDDNDDTYKCIAELKQTANKTESLVMENKLLISQIAENNRINEEVENLRKQISELEVSIQNKNTENEKLLEHENMTNRLEKIQNLLLSEEPSINDDDNDDICKLIIKLHKNSISLGANNLNILDQINENQDSSTDIENLKKKITDLEEEVKLRESQKECLQSKLLELENIACHYQKVRDSLQSTEEPLLENSDVIKQISDLHRMASRTELLENEKAQLLNEIAEIRQSAEILTEKLQNQTLSEAEYQLREKIDALEVELKEANERFDEQIVKNNDIESNNLDLQIKIEEVLEEKENLLSQLEEFKSKNEVSACTNCDKIQDMLNDSTNKIHAYEIEISQLTSKLDEANIQNTELLKSNKNHTDQILNIEAELIEVKEQSNERASHENNNYSKDTTIIDFQQKYEEVLKEKDDLIVKVVMLDGDVKFKTNELTKLHDQLDENVKRIQEFENEIYKLSLKLDDAKIETAKEMESKADLQAKVDEVNESSLAVIEQLNFDLLSKTNEICELEVHLSEKTKKITECETEIAQLNSKYSTGTESSSDLHTQMEEIIQVRESLLTQVEQLKEIIGSKDSELVVLKEQMDVLAKKNDRCEEEIAQLSSKSSTATESSSDLHTQMEEIIQVRESLLTQVEQLKEIIGSKDSELVVLKEQMNEYAKKNYQYEEEIAQLNSKYSAATESSSDLHTQMEEIIQVKESLLSQVEQLKEIIGSKDSELVVLKEQMNEYAKKNYQYEEEIAQLNSKYSTATESSSDLHTQMEEIIQLKESLLSQVEQFKEIIGSKDSELVVLKEQMNEYAKKISDYENEISQLTFKYNEINNQNTRLQELNSDYMHQVSKLGAELTNSQSQNLLKEEEFKNLQKELSQINDQIKQKVKECEELKIRYRRRSEDNERKHNELEMANTKLLQEVGAAEAIRTSIENDLKKMKEEYDQIRDYNKSLKEENNNHDMKYTILDEKYSQLSAINLKLEEKVKDLKKIIESKNNEVIKKLEKEIIELNAKLWKKTTENESKAAIIKELNQKCELLVKEVEENQLKTKKSFSPPHRRSDEKELFAPQHMLNVDSSTPSRTVKSNIERKTRRQSVYDERRDLSAWELIQSNSTQTDPVDKLCRCDELDELIKELRVELRFRDIKIANNQRMANINIYKYQLEDAKLEYQKEKRENNKLRDIKENLEEKLHSAKSKIQELERSKRSLEGISKSAQTEYNVILKDEYEKVVYEKNVLEKKLNEVKLQLSQEKKLSEKENLSLNTRQLQNIPSNENDMSDRSNSIKLDYDILSNDYKTLQKKYDTAKRLCNLRQDDLNKLRDELQNQTLITEKMVTKYEKAKQLLEIRMEKIRNLREQLGETQDPKEFTDFTATH
ncbi:hypothetical protein ACKWTF_002101 [Chironomus riparius]